MGGRIVLCAHHGTYTYIHVDIVYIDTGLPFLPRNNVLL